MANRTGERLARIEQQTDVLVQSMSRLQAKLDAAAEPPKPASAAPAKVEFAGSGRAFRVLQLEEAGDGPNW